MHIAIKGRRLECEWLQLGVAGDGGVEQYHFQVPRYTGSGLDLSQAMAYILFERPDGTQGMTPILEPDKEIGSTTVTLRWLVGREITEQPGRLRIAIKFSGLEGETWHSEAADCVVAATIEASSPQPVSLFSAKTAARTAVPDNEPPITVSERTLNIPAGLQNIAVQNDQNSETVTMICPRYFDGHDLSSYSFFLRTQNSEGGYDPVALPVTVQGGELHMEWTLRPPQTSYSGRLQIQLWVTGEDFDWQTAEASVNIVRQIGGEPVIPVSPPVMDEFLKQISVVAEKAKTSETAAAASASAAGASEAAAASSAAEAAASQTAAAGSAAAAQNAAAAAAASASDAAASAALAEQHAVPVSDAEINEAGHLVVTLSNGNRIDAGEARGPQGPEGVEGPAGQSPYEAAV
ncbi:MAG: hypothetical protein HFG26_09205, partial [Provencibacterium sp.]|nr:hypothetical protein [Provencibacterium sp.]